MESPASTWGKLRAEYTELERTFGERTTNLSAEKRADIWGPAGAFADQAALDQLKGNSDKANSALSWAITNARRILAELN